jgi:hypothetical protein
MKTARTALPAPAPLDFVWKRPSGRDGFDVKAAGPMPRHYHPTWPASDGAFRVVPKREVAFESYAPMREESGLFRNFAETPPTADGVLAFANRYGCLGDVSLIPVTRQAQSPLVPDKFDYPDSRVATEEGHDWLAAILWVRFVARFWEASSAGDASFLSNFLSWRGQGAVTFTNPAYDLGEGVPRHPILRPTEAIEVLSRDTNPELLAGARPGDLVLPAKVFVQKSLNLVLNVSASSQMVWSRERAAPVLQWLPRHLFGAMCLQLALAVSEGKEYRRCSVCGKWFELAPDVNRKSRLTCSSSCRNKLYRERQDEARRLHAAGKTAKQIAKTLRADPEAVARWVEDKKNAQTEE